MRIEMHYTVKRFNTEGITQRLEFVKLTEDDLEAAALLKAGDGADNVEFVRMEVGD